MHDRADCANPAPDKVPDVEHRGVSALDIDTP